MERYDDGLDAQLIDPVVLDEVELLTEIVIAVQTFARRLKPVEVDRLLGLAD